MVFSRNFWNWIGLSLTQKRIPLLLLYWFQAVNIRDLSPNSLLQIRSTALNTILNYFDYLKFISPNKIESGESKGHPILGMGFFPPQS